MEDKFKPGTGLVTQLISAHIVACGGHPVPEDIVNAYLYWKGLFEEYNEAAIDPARKEFLMVPLKMGCRACYLKVWQWHRMRGRKKYTLVRAAWNKGLNGGRPGINQETITLHLDSVEGLVEKDQLTVDLRAGQTVAIWSIKSDAEPYYVNCTLVTDAPTKSWLNETTLQPGIVWLKV